MSSPDYEVHIDRALYDAMFDKNSEQGTVPFTEDLEDIERILAEEIGAPRRRRRRGKSASV